MIRDDYKELVLLAILLLGGSRSDGIKIFAPGAQHHARWMAAVIYTIKIALFAHQLTDVFEKWYLDMVVDLAVFLVLFYVKYWLCCTSPSDAPILDLEFLQLLEKASSKVSNDNFNKFIEATLNKLKVHLWYLSERQVPLSFFSTEVNDKNKSNMAKEMILYEGIEAAGTQDIPTPGIAANFSSLKLKQFVGSDSWTFFKLIGVEPTFLYIRVSDWERNDV